VAGPDGQAVNWYPLSEASDLPCFVRMLTQNSPKVLVSGLPAVRASVRMETPVIYFYAPRETTVGVSVRFPMGLITEWFPDAVVARRSCRWTPLTRPAHRLARVTVHPRRDVEFLSSPGSHTPARGTDWHRCLLAASTKFLFYRGMAGFPVTVEARVSRPNRREQPPAPSR
jgi:hypothetical protein